MHTTGIFAGKRRVAAWRTPSVTADFLKNFACVVMMVQTIGIAVVEKGMIKLDGYMQAGLSQAMAQDSGLMFLAGLGSVMQLVGGLAMPVFTFLLVEGFLHTSDYRRYFIRMAVTAAVSEIPYDLAMGNGGLDWGSQNAMVSMCICLLMLRFLQMFRDKKSVGGYMASAAVVLGAVLWVTLLRAQYGLCLVLLTAVFYLLYAKNVWKTVLGILASLLYVTGPLSFYAIWCYNGSRKDRASKYVYYALYPLHLLVFALIARLV